MRNRKWLLGIAALALVSVLTLGACDTTTGGDGGTSGGSGLQVKIIKATGSKGSLTDEDLPKLHLASVDIPKAGSVTLGIAINKGEGWLKRGSATEDVTFKYYYDEEEKSSRPDILYGPDATGSKLLKVTNGEKIKVEATWGGKTASAETTIKVTN